MKGLLSKQLTRLVSSSSSRKKTKERTVTVFCTPDKTTESIIQQLKDLTQSRSNVTKLVLQDILQRSDNAQLFSAIRNLLMKDTIICQPTNNNKKKNNSSSNKKKNNGNNLQLQSIVLAEPHVRGQDYRRWCYKRTNFLHHVARAAKNMNIDVQIEATLILEVEASPPSSSSPSSTDNDVSSVLSVLQQQLPQDPDIVSLWLSLQDVPVVADLNNSSNNNNNDCSRKTTRRPSMLELQQSPVQKIFSALIELFNSDTRHWRLIHCHVLYDPAERNVRQGSELLLQDEQTQSLLEVAELYHIPLQVQWQPKGTYDGEQSDHDTTTTTTTTTTHSTTPVQQRQRKQLPPSRKSGGKVDKFNKDSQDDVTASSTDHEYSSGALVLATRSCS